MAGRGGARKRTVNPDKLSDDEYRMKRKKNNDAVNKTRQKKRQEENDISKRVEELRKENDQLERKVEGLQKELAVLKEMFVAYANKGKEQDSGIDTAATYTAPSGSSSSSL